MASRGGPESSLKGLILLPKHLATQKKEMGIREEELALFRSTSFDFIFHFSGSMN